jgi:hypothetical protein
MSLRDRPFFKGLPRFVAANDAMEAADAHESVYYWWWAFARLSPVLWYAKQTGIKPIDPAIAKVSEALGDVWKGGFGFWWQTSGSKVFAETQRPARVHALDLETLHEHPFDPTKLYIEVPLNIRQQTIVSQFKKLLTLAHEGRSLNLAAHSTANLALHTKRYRLPTLENEYWVLLYRLLYPKIEVWRIGDRLRIAPQHEVRNAAGSRLTKSKHALNALVGRYHYKARFTLLNLERDSFPNYTPIEVTGRKQPFGMEHQKDFRVATGDSADGELSAWTKWLREQYADTLQHQIIRKNRWERQFRLPDGKLRQRIAAYVAGTSDLLD